MVRSRKAESNVIAEIMMVGIAVALSTVVFFTLRGNDTAGGFGSLIGTFEAPSEILSINGLSQKCPGTDASVAVKNTGGLDANVKAVAINDATKNTNVNVKYPSTATYFLIVSGSTSDSVDKSRCNDSGYLNIASVFAGTTYQASAIFNGTSDPTLSPSNIKLYFDSTFTQPGVGITLQGYDYSLPNGGAFSTTTGQKSYAFATLGSDYIVNMDLDPSKYLNSNGPWQIKVTATNSVPFTMSVDLLQVNTIASKPVLMEIVYPQNIVISPGQTVLVNATLSRTLDTDTSYRVAIVTERNSYSTVILN